LFSILHPARLDLVSKVLSFLLLSLSIEIISKISVFSYMYAFYSGLMVDTRRRTQLKATRRKGLESRNVDSRFQAQLEEDGSSSRAWN